jgi:hypothetical protein
MITKDITYNDLSENLKKGLRNGNWRKLRFLDKALYRAAIEYAKRGVSIVNEKLVEKLWGLVARLKETKGMIIFRRGLKRAVEMLEKGEDKGVFIWAPRLRCWLKDPSYVFWLGAMR